jgi:hypothetical protein
MLSRTTVAMLLLAAVLFMVSGHGAAGAITKAIQIAGVLRHEGLYEFLRERLEGRRAGQCHDVP